MVGDASFIGFGMESSWAMMRVKWKTSFWNYGSIPGERLAVKPVNFHSFRAIESDESINNKFMM